MGFTYEDRPTDSPYIEGIAHVIAETEIAPLCRADERWELVVKTYQGRRSMILAGPMSKVIVNTYEAGSEFLVIKFKLGLFMPYLPIRPFIDREVPLPDASSKTFWLNGSSWQYFDFNNVETFLDRLVRDEALVWDAVVASAMRDRPQDISPRTIRHRFLHATGLSQNSIRQIERARRAAELLEGGTPILDTVYQLGYADQPHLTRAIKHFTGQTPAQIARTFD